jgi:nanoRNase/pAp phosphatase (c-di-AMP/oligoRNAs hydrolase)
MTQTQPPTASSTPTQKYRLVTRSDFDGLVCAVLLKELGMLDDIKFVHPKDMQDGKIEVSARDITTNVPYVPGVHMAFDHHLSETLRVKDHPKNHIIDPDAPSAARVVYKYFGGKAKFPRISDEMMAEVDKADAAQFSREEILKPKGWVLLNYIMDPRTGLGRFREFRISNYQLMMNLIDACLTLSIDEILALPDVKERVDLYTDHQAEAQDQLLCCSKVHGKLVVLDLRDQAVIHPSNRFLIYALFPKCNISMHIMWGLKKQNVVFAIGKSILDRSSKTNVGDLALQYEGGGHNAAGTCQIPADRAEAVGQELIARITADG